MIKCPNSTFSYQCWKYWTFWNDTQPCTEVCMYATVPQWCELSGERDPPLALLKVSSLSSPWRVVWEFFLIRCEVLGQGCQCVQIVKPSEANLIMGYTNKLNWIEWYIILKSNVEVIQTCCQHSSQIKAELIGRLVKCQTTESFWLSRQKTKPTLDCWLDSTVPYFGLNGTEHPKHSHVSS